MNDHVSLRDFIERIIAENNLRRDDLRTEDRRWIEHEFRALAKALDLQAIDYKEHLERLNGAHEEARRVESLRMATFLPRELYDRAHSEVVEWQRKADVRNVEIDARIKSVELGLVNLPGGIKSLELGLAAQTGQQIGTRMTTATAITLISLVIVFVGGIVGLLNFVLRQ